VKQPGREVDCSSSFRSKDKNKWSYTSTPSKCVHGVDRDKFTFFTLLRKIEILYTKINRPIPVAARFKSWVYGRSLARIVGSNPAGGLNVCIL
jgi:hypothetical protein